MLYNTGSFHSRNVVSLRLCFSVAFIVFHLNVAYLSLFLHVLLLFVPIKIEVTSQLYFTSDWDKGKGFHFCTFKLFLTLL